ncbi:unnamed protein product [Vitrella brassicaformis CCMP3155]|uniref:EF-hand domain-containing protein n=1 Tax=Vitrella brassicaformis (strain CCMP3155) TaxID=1169540 RepID=A0A0G4EXS2_VITBC|nr:unnamed protein product [Vitrella brassicaformis CCMP3155]|eukprot:CEM03516.1 unnamed protein product [Vitrella brassicaformis CCMP3155]
MTTISALAAAEAGEPEERGHIEADHLSASVAFHGTPRTTERDQESGHTFSTQFDVLFGAVIVLNAVIIGVEVDWGKKMKEGKGRRELHWFVLENIFAAVFFLEFVLRYRVLRNMLRFLSGGGRCCRCVGAHVDHGDNSKRYSVLTLLRIVRLFRLARLVRLFRIFKELWLLMSGLVTSMRTLSWVGLLLFLFLYISAIFVTQIVKQSSEFEGDEEVRDLWGTVPRSMFTLFQVMTMADWAEPVRHVMTKMPWLAAFFILFIGVTAFAIMNLVIGIICESTLSAVNNDEREVNLKLEEEWRTLLESLHDIFDTMNHNSDGAISRDDFLDALQDDKVVGRLLAVGIEVVDAEELYDVLDANGDGVISLDEFIDGCVRLKGAPKSVNLLAVQCDQRNIKRRLVHLEKRLDTLIAAAVQCVATRTKGGDRRQTQAADDDAAQDNKDSSSSSSSIGGEPEPGEKTHPEKGRTAIGAGKGVDFTHQWLKRSRTDHHHHHHRQHSSSSSSNDDDPIKRASTTTDNLQGSIQLSLSQPPCPAIDTEAMHTHTCEGLHESGHGMGVSMRASPSDGDMHPPNSPPRSEPTCADAPNADGGMTVDYDVGEGRGSRRVSVGLPHVDER